MSIDINELKAVSERFIETLDNDKDEHYNTEQDIASDIMGRFIAYLTPKHSATDIEALNERIAELEEKLEEKLLEIERQLEYKEYNL